MKKKIKAYDQLLLEEQQLEEALELHQVSMAHKWKLLKQSVQPAAIGIKIAETAFTRADNYPVVNAGVNFAVNLLVKKWILKKSGWLTKMLVPFLVKNITSNVIQKNMLRAEKRPLS